jgi:hypothetical protein
MELTIIGCLSTGTSHRRSLLVRNVRFARVRVVQVQKKHTHTEPKAIKYGGDTNSCLDPPLQSRLLLSDVALIHLTSQLNANHIRWKRIHSSTQDIRKFFIGPAGLPPPQPRSISRNVR